MTQKGLRLKWRIGEGKLGTYAESKIPQETENQRGKKTRLCSHMALMKSFVFFVFFFSLRLCPRFMESVQPHGVAVLTIHSSPFWLFFERKGTEEEMVGGRFL